MIGPVGRPNVVRGAPDEQIKRQSHLCADDGGLGFVGVRSDPTAVGEPIAGVFVGAARALDDAIHGDEFDDDELSHIPQRVMYKELQNHSNGTV